MKFLGSHKLSAGRTVKLLLNKKQMPLLFDDLVKDTIKNGLITYLYTQKYIRDLLSNQKEEQLYDNFWNGFNIQVKKINLVAKEVFIKKKQESFGFQINIYKDIVLSLSKDFGINKLDMSIWGNEIKLRIKTSSVPYRHIWLEMEQNSDILETTISGVERKYNTTFKYEEIPYNEYPKDYFTKKGLSSRYPIKFYPIRDKFWASRTYSTPKYIEERREKYKKRFEESGLDMYEELLNDSKTFPKSVTFTSAISPFKFEENTVMLEPYADWNDEKNVWKVRDWKVFENGIEQPSWGKNLNEILNTYLFMTYQAWKENEEK